MKAWLLDKQKNGDDGSGFRDYAPNWAGLCLLCGERAKHLPVVGFFGETESYCCHCFGCNGSYDKTQCYNYEGLDE